MSKVLTVGTFDLFHSGHANLIFNCAKIAGIAALHDKHKMSEYHNVTIGLNSDEFVEKYKGKRPLYSYSERRSILINNRYVWSVVKNDTPTIKPLLMDSNNNPKCDILAVGSDWAKKDYFEQIGVNQHQLDLLGILLVYVPYTEGISTTDLKERILNSD